MRYVGVSAAWCSHKMPMRLQADVVAVDVSAFVVHT